MSQLSDAQLEQIAQAVDQDSNGTISKEEFEARMEVIQEVMSGGGEPASDDEAQEAGSLEEHLEKVGAEVEAQMEEFYGKLQEMDENEAQAYFMENQPDFSEYAEEMMEMVSENEDDPAVPEALMFVIRSAQGSELADAAQEMLLEDHLDSSEAMRVLSYQARYQGDSVFQDILENNSDPKILATVRFVYAEYLLDMDSMRAYMADEIESREKDPKDEALELLNMVIEDENTSEKTLSAAKRRLFVLENLVVGKEAPEIEGLDTDGVSFKLSDYRGKVVMLDFWGNW